MNGRLVVYLKKPSTLRRLLEYLIGRPPLQKSFQRDAAGKADETRTKHSMVACEVLCNLAEGLPGALAGSNDMLELLFSAAGVHDSPHLLHAITLLSELCKNSHGLSIMCFAETPSPLDCTLAGYFSRLVGILLSRCAEQMMAYLEVSAREAAG